MQSVEIRIPTKGKPHLLMLEAGKSTILVGANGSGKTRLGVFLEGQTPADRGHRIAAHRSLVWGLSSGAISFEQALTGLHFGTTYMGAGRPLNKYNRWKEEPATHLLADFDYVLQALFAEQNRLAVNYLHDSEVDKKCPVPVTRLKRLQLIWEKLLPHRKFQSQELSIQIKSSKLDSDYQAYEGSQLSDGERVIFYLIGQCLLAPDNSVIIIDEPELHIHKAIIGPLWDMIEAERQDCSFVYITHDLDFVTARPMAKKIVVREFSPPECWDIEPLPADTGLSERVISELVGSRQPVLFVEGDRGSIDAAIYRHVYQDFLIEPVGPCDAVIHAVASFRSNPALHRIGSVRGCVDADARDCNEISHLNENNVYVLPVAEIENIFIIPDVFIELGKSLNFSINEIERKTIELISEIIDEAKNDLERAAIRYASRRLDAALKKLAPSAKSLTELVAKYKDSVASVDPEVIAKTYKDKLENKLAEKDIIGILSLYDNKGLLSIGAKKLGLKGKKEVIELACRILLTSKESALLNVLRGKMPSITA